MPDPSPSEQADRQDQMLRQLTTLARSVERLAKGTAPPPAPPPPEPDPDADVRRRVQFAYLFLSEVLGRQGRPAPLPRVQVTRKPTGLTFTGLAGATAARLRGAQGSTDLLLDLGEGGNVSTSIPNREPIDAILTLESRDGAPVALGPCLPAVDEIIIE